MNSKTLIQWLYKFTDRDSARKFVDQAKIEHPNMKITIGEMLLINNIIEGLPVRE